MSEHIDARWMLSNLSDAAGDATEAVALMAGIWERDQVGEDRYLVAFDPHRRGEQIDTPAAAGVMVCDPRVTAEKLWDLDADRRWLYIDSPTCDWLLGCAGDMPSDVTVDIDTLNDYGIVLLEHQIPSPGVDGVDCPLHAIAWSVNREQRLLVMFFVAHLGDHSVPVGFSVWHHGYSVDDADGLTGDADSHAWDRRFLAAVWHLADRDDTASTHNLDRPQRRRATREGRSVPPVRVVRTGESSGDGGGDPGRGTGVGASKHWWVSGHWRSQPYGTGRALRRPKWIAAHLAGNREGPLITPRPSVQRPQPPTE